MSCKAMRRKRSAASAVYIGVGSNKGNRRRNISGALRLLQEEVGVRLEAVSPFYETRPEGGPAGQRNYCNGVIRVRTALTNSRLLAVLKKVEARLGRRAGIRGAAREVDLDILVRGGQVVRKKDLCIPHPRLVRRAFVLRPLADLAPALRHPVTRKTVAEHLRQVAGNRKVRDRRIADFL